MATFLLERSFRTFDEVAGVGRQVIFCINSCRSRGDLQDLPKRYNNERGRKNRFYILFSTRSGQTVPLEHHVFKEVVEELMPLFKSDNVQDVLIQMLQKILQRGNGLLQPQPCLHIGGFADSSSSLGSSPNFSFATSTNLSDQVEGQCCML